MTKKTRKSKNGKLGIGAIARQLILKGWNFQDTLKGIKKVHPKTQFSKRCFYWFRYHLRRGDYGKVKVPSLS